MSEIVDEPEDGLHTNVGHIALAQVVVVKQGPEAHAGVFYPINGSPPGNFGKCQ